MIGRSKRPPSGESSVEGAPARTEALRLPQEPLNSIITPKEGHQGE